MEVNKLDNLEIYQFGFEINKIANDAIDIIKKQNKKLGIPLVYSKNGKLYFELPDGRIVTENPF